MEHFNHLNTNTDAEKLDKNTNLTDIANISDITDPHKVDIVDLKKKGYRIDGEERVSKKRSKKNRCNVLECKKKLGLLGFECKCGHNFCGKHRHAEQHECSFDYVKFGKSNLEKNNKKLVGDMFERL